MLHQKLSGSDNWDGLESLEQSLEGPSITLRVTLSGLRRGRGQDTTKEEERLGGL